MIHDAPVCAVDVTRWFVRVFTLIMLAMTGFNALHGVVQHLVVFRSSPATHLWNSLIASGAGSLVWCVIWLFSGGISEALASKLCEENTLSARMLGALAWRCFGFAVAAEGLSAWVFSVGYAITNVVTSYGIDIPLLKLLREASTSMGHEALLFLRPVLQVGLGFFLAFLLPRLRQMRRAAAIPPTNTII